uniref:Protein kinase domain-containing protein n=1 Tax=Panagrolaimus sp. ES5 TaxID=591445 RepID=A0AC34GDR0_9BILA
MSLLGKELGDLQRRLPERKMTLSTVLRIACQSSQAIQDLHQAGFIHRDIKQALPRATGTIAAHGSCRAV